MKQRARWWIALLVVGGIVAGALTPGLAQEPAELRRLMMENYAAQVIADLNLTPQQKLELKEIIDRYRGVAEERRSELVRLLAERRDALLAGNQEKLSEVEEALRQLAQQDPWEGDEKAQAFFSGLTERQKQVLGRVLPDIETRQAKQMRSRAESRLAPHAGMRFEESRMPAWRGPVPNWRDSGPFHRTFVTSQRIIDAYGGRTELLDVFSKMLEQ